MSYPQPPQPPPPSGGYPQQPGVPSGPPPPWSPVQAPGAYPGAPPFPPPPPSQAPFGAPVAASKPRRSPGVIIAIIAIVAVVLSGGAFALVSLTGKDTKSDANAAVKAFFDALETGDEVQIAATLVERERSIVQNNIEDLRTFLRKSTEGYESRLADIVELDIKELKTNVTRSENGASFVQIDVLKGTAIDKTGRRSETAEFSIEGTRATSVSEDGTETENLAAPIVFVTIDDGASKVSILYTIVANAVAQTNGGQLTLPNITPRGAATPEAAVQGLFTAIENTDIRALAASFDPYEQRLGASLLALFESNEALKDGLAQFRDNDVKFNLDLKFESIGDNRAKVSLAGTVTANGEKQNFSEVEKQLRKQGIPGFYLVTTRSSSGWHVSILETVAALLRDYAANN